MADLGSAGFFFAGKVSNGSFSRKIRRGRDILTSKLSRAQRSAIETPLNSDQNCCSENKKYKDFYLQPSREEVLTVFSRQVKSICKKNFLSTHRLNPSIFIFILPFPLFRLEYILIINLFIFKLVKAI